MRTTSAVYFGMVAVGIVVLLAASPARLSAQQNPAEAVRIGDSDLGGVVTSAQGPDRRVGDRGDDGLAHQVHQDCGHRRSGALPVPDLPKAKYKVWVRGYGLVDSPQVDSEPGKMLNLTAVGAPNEAAAAQYYPAIYWYAMLQIPEQSQFGGKSDIPEKLTQIDWLKQVKNIGCIGCHQLGQLSTHVPAGTGGIQVARRGMDTSHSGGTVWRADAEPACQELRRRTVQILRRLDGTHRQGELPPSKPTRPQGRAQHRCDVVGVAY